jgi:hypothetical protein
MRIAPADIIANIIADMARPLPLSLHASFTERESSQRTVPRFLTFLGKYPRGLNLKKIAS